MLAGGRRYSKRKLVTQIKAVMHHFINVFIKNGRLRLTMLQLHLKLSHVDTNNQAVDMLHSHLFHNSKTVNIIRGESTKQSLKQSANLLDLLCMPLFYISFHSNQR